MARLPLLAILLVVGCSVDRADDDATSEEALAKLRIKDLGTLGGDFSQAFDVEDGVVVGEAATGALDPDGVPVSHAFRWSRGSMHDLGTPPGGINSRATLIRAGAVAGAWWSFGGDERAFVVRKDAMRDLGSLGGTFAHAAALNAHGVIVGSSTTEAGEVHAFVYREGVMHDLGTLGGRTSEAHDVSDAGEIVGESETSDGTLHAFAMHAGVMRDLGTLGGDFTSSSAISIAVDGTIVGRSWKLDRTSHAVEWTPQIVDLVPSDSPLQVGEAIAAGRHDTIIGNARASYGARIAHPFVWRDGAFTEIVLPQGGGTVCGIDRAGVVAGSFTFGLRTGHAFVWRRGRVGDLGTLGGEISWANAIDARGEVVGAAATTGGAVHAALWRVGAPRL